jgi:hypothetical protein
LQPSAWPGAAIHCLPARPRILPSRGGCAILGEIDAIDQVNEVRTMHFGPAEVLLIVSADFRDDTLAGKVKHIVSDVEDRIRDEFQDVRRVYIEAQSIDRHLEALDDIGEEADALERESIA